MNILSALLLVAIFSCSDAADKIEPEIQGNVPAKVSGKWMHGYFSMSTFWGYDGSYQGNPFQQAEVYDFKPNGEYEMYYTGAVNDYGCRTEALSYFKGKVKFDAENESFTITPQSARFRGFYSCAANRNFDRNAEKSELKTQTFLYKIIEDVNGNKALEITLSNGSKSTFLPTSW